MRLALAAAAAITASLPAVLAGTSPRSRVVPSDTLLRADDVLSLPYESHPPSVLLRRTLLSQDASTSVTTASDNKTTDGGNNNNNSDVLTVRAINATAWDAVTDAACVDALAALTRSTNPSGNCLCYNLPSLDTATGVFEADLRLYRISAPRDAFAGVAPTDISVGVSYSGASVSPVNADELMGLGAVANRTRLVIAPRADQNQGRDAAAAAANGDGPKLLRKYLFVGQIDKARMEQNMSM